MTDKSEQQNSNNDTRQQWGLVPPGFGGRNTGEHPFNYDELNRVGDGSQPEFDAEAARQQTAPFMQNFFPRIGLPFPDFTDYPRFNGFQRNTFFPNPFGPQFPNSAFSHSFPLNSMHNPMMNMEGFNFHHGQHPLVQNVNTAKQRDHESSSQATAHSSVDIQDKPPALSSEYPVKQNIEMSREFVNISKNEPMDQSSGKSKKNDSQSFLFPPITMEKPFEQARIRDETLAFNPSFYSSPLNIGSNNAFKREMTTPSDGHIDYRKFDTNGKRLDFQPSGTLHDCQVCLSTHANGLHFGARTCAACAAFFRRTISDDKRYVCKRNQRCTNASRDGTGYRKICRSCRMKRCLEIGMLPENVQHKRNRRSSGSPPRKTPFDNFFNGFYPNFQNPGSTVQPIALSSADVRHVPS